MHDLTNAPVSEWAQIPAATLHNLVEIWDYIRPELHQGQNFGKDHYDTCANILVGQNV